MPLEESYLCKKQRTFNKAQSGIRAKSALLVGGRHNRRRTTPYSSHVTAFGAFNIVALANLVLCMIEGYAPVADPE